MDRIPAVTRGGQREGAGRKPLEGGRVTAAFVLREDQVAWLDLRARNRALSKSEYIRQLLDQAMRIA